MIISTFQSALAGDWELFGQKLRALWDIAWGAIKATISNAWTSIKAKAKEIIENLKNFFKNADWKQIGIDIVKGIGNGLAAMNSWIKDKARAVAQAALDAAKGFLGIQSPSKAFGELGKFSAQGFGLAFEKTMGGFQPQISAAMSMPSSSVATPSAGGISASDLQGMQSEPINYPKLARSMRDAFLRETQ